MSQSEAVPGRGREWIHGHVKLNERVWDQAPEVLSSGGLKDAKTLVDALRTRGWDITLLKQRHDNPWGDTPLHPIGVDFYENGEDNPGLALYLDVRERSNGVRVVLDSRGGFDNSAGQLIPPFENVTEIGLEKDTITISQTSELGTRSLVLGPNGGVSYIVNIAPQPLEQS